MQVSSDAQGSQPPAPGAASSPLTAPEKITLYHWLVVLIASAGWLFDCMDQRLFTLARESALKDLLAGNPTQLSNVKEFIGLATMAMMVGWATGGIIFGVMSDKWGRVKTMAVTLLVYSGFTGLCGLAQGWLDFVLYRFLVGLGVGGMFGAATTLVAESVPGHFRTVALGSLQALSAVGNMLGAALSLGINPGREAFFGNFPGWRVLFFVGIVPAILVVPIIFMLKEPEAWKRAKAQAVSGKRDAAKVGSMGDLFRHPRWRRNTLVGICLGLAGMVGLWGIGFFSPELISTALKEQPLQAKDLRQPQAIVSALQQPANAALVSIKDRLSPDLVRQIDQSAGTETPASLQANLLKELNGLILTGSLYNESAFQEVPLKKSTLNLVQQLATKPAAADQMFLNRQLLEQTFPGALAEMQQTMDKVRGKGMLLQDVGSLLGMFTFTFLAAAFSRRLAFLLSFAMCLVTTAYVFYALKSATDAYWMLPLMGFAQLAVFAGYSIYFPEIYPTRLRGTGVGFCYNTVRYLAAPFPYMLGWLSTQMPFRTAAILMSGIYLVGMGALLWAPETKGKPLPED
ncbi:MAG TPA: MFS transporter [Verrucomicrobiota bacterium]|nr:MAG: putative sialic acid transporter [Verrucomicrobia bacterium ADurb.Bin118]HQB17874.1 MFS transporter [Verrucomicrobiota bacterium]